MIMRRWLAVALAAACAASGACAGVDPLRQQRCENPGARLASATADLPPDACAGADEASRSGTCERARLAVARILAVCPGHEPTLLTAAALAYESREPERAQQWLDELLRVPAAHPAAAMLRARIAIAQGNLPYARRLLGEQLRLRPDHAGLHEALASALFFSADYPSADEELARALSLGAPPWRVSYHRGLVAERDGRADDAAALFRQALQENPASQEVRARVRALDATGAADSPLR